MPRSIATSTRVELDELLGFARDRHHLVEHALDQRPEIALLFTDVVMPEVNGVKLAESARRRRPALKVLFTTGYAGSTIIRAGAVVGAT